MIRNFTRFPQRDRKLYTWAFLLPALLCLLGMNEAWATHIRAGDLTATRISPNSLTYRFTVILYRDRSGVPAQEGLFEFGYQGTCDERDNRPCRYACSLISPTSLGNLDDETEIIIYQVEHTFPSPGRYKVSYYEQNRNPGIRNMFASGQTPFYIESEFLINPVFGLNTSPVLLIPPVDKAAVGQRFIHNPGAFDSEGDSLSYRLTISKQDRSSNNCDPIEVTQYRFPDDPAFNGVKEDGSGPATLTIDPINGDLIWDAPGEPGEYNVAFFVDEWRGGVRIGSVNRDMQIIVLDNPNNRPELIIPRDTCIVAGTYFADTITAIDPDDHFVRLTAEGALFEPPILGGHTNQAEFDLLNLQPPNGEEKGIFKWQTECADVRREPYQATFKAEDLPQPDTTLKLVDIQTWRIRVVGPAPDTLIALPDFANNTVELIWNSYACQNASEMTIWRRRGGFEFEPDNCQTGLPAFTGYRQIGSVGIGDTTFFDNNNGQGLEKGSTYCYRIFARFPEPGGGESLASMEVCVFIPQIAPYIVEVSVEETSRTNGSIDVTWTKPINLDTVLFPDPITYRLLRNEGLSNHSNPVQIPVVFNEEDTTYTDTGLDTERLPYNYQVLIYSQGALIDTSSAASSVDLSLNPRVNTMELDWETDVPWSNASSRFPIHYIYREDPNSPGDFVLIDSVDVTISGFNYVDEGDIPGFPIEEREEYCYKVLTVGTYDNPLIRDSLLNFSQEACATVLDTTAPCPPVLTLSSDACETEPILSNQNAECTNVDTLYTNTLTWEPDLSAGCDIEIVSYNIYYAPREGQELQLLASDILGTTFEHENLSSIAGCYAITALDPSGNESQFSNIECIDNCPLYRLPNVFTPNGDNVNDTFRPFKCTRFVRAVEFQVFNRWGQLLFETDEDFFINWDGRDSNGNEVPAGTYFYIAKLRTIRLSAADEVEEVKGWVQVLRDSQP